VQRCDLKREGASDEERSYVKADPVKREREKEETLGRTQKSIGRSDSRAEGGRWKLVTSKEKSSKTGKKVAI
jgi:hypothetical protein